MTGRAPPRGISLSLKGRALPPPEPALKTPRTVEGRRVGATLPTETYVRFKAYVARSGTTGERAILAAIEWLLASPP